MSEVVKKYYDTNAEYESNRLTDPYSAIEFKSTIRLIEKYFPKTGLVCDLGCGPGRYSIEMLKRGYQVTLFDLSSKELEIAKQRIAELQLEAEGYICSSATQMESLETGIYDIVLNMGPLYHIIEDVERAGIIQNTARILKDDGIALFAYINSWGCIKAGVCEFSDTFRNLEALYGYLDAQILDENHGFTECFFTTPPKALGEIKQNGFEILGYAGAESFLGGMRSEVSRLYLEDRLAYDNLLQVASETCEMEPFRDSTEHLVIIARKRT